MVEFIFTMYIFSSLFFGLLKHPKIRYTGKCQQHYLFFLESSERSKVHIICYFNNQMEAIISILKRRDLKIIVTKVFYMAFIVFSYNKCLK